MDSSQFQAEVLQYLEVDVKPNLQLVALQVVLGITATPDGSHLTKEELQLLLTKLTPLLVHKDSAEPIKKQIFNILINLSAEDTHVWLLAHNTELITYVLKGIIYPDCHWADSACKLLSNITRHSICCEEIYQIIEDTVKLDKLVHVLCQENYNQQGVDLQQLAYLIGNLTQVVKVRKQILTRESCLIQRLLPFTQYIKSKVKRRGIIAALKNCCFETEYHDWLLSDEVDILPALLLPLAGPEQFDDDDMEQLPVDLQYLDENKIREENPEIRKMLLETITQLCTTRKNREYMRTKQAYLILREYHKWETNQICLLILEDLINILIRTEEEIGEDNLKEVQIPDDIQKKFDLEIDQNN